MKNRDKDALYKPNRCTFVHFFFIVFVHIKKAPVFITGAQIVFIELFDLVHHFFNQFYRTGYIR